MKLRCVGIVYHEVLTMYITKSLREYQLRRHLCRWTE